MRALVSFIVTTLLFCAAIGAAVLGNAQSAKPQSVNHAIGSVTVVTGGTRVTFSCHGTSGRCVQTAPSLRSCVTATLDASTGSVIGVRIRPCASSS